MHIIMHMYIYLLNFVIILESNFNGLKMTFQINFFVFFHLLVITVSSNSVVIIN